MYKISIIIPIYKVEKFIKQCLESVIKQLSDDVQIVCVNDGTPDQSMEIAKNTVSQCSINIQKQFLFINQENQGLSVARNTGLDHATGEYIGFLDSDDMLNFNYFNKILAIVNKEDYDIIDFNLITSDGNVIKTRESNDGNVFTSMKWFCPTRVFKSYLFKNYRFTPGIYYEDLDLTPKLYVATKKTFHLDEILYWYRKNNEGITNSVNNKSNLKTLESLEIILNNYIYLYAESKNLKYAVVILQTYFLLCINACKRFISC